MKTKILALFLLLASLIIYPSAQPSPQAEPLIQSTSLSYLGSFRIPTGGGGTYSFGYALTGLAFNPAHNSLFINNHIYEQKTAEVSIPTLTSSQTIGGLATGTFLQTLSDITEGHLANIGPNGTSFSGTIYMGGLMIYNGKLVGTAYAFYDGGSFAALSHFYHSPTLNQTGTFRGMYQVGILNPGLYAGNMTPIPAEWQPLLGGPALTGQCCIPIITRSSFGPSAFVFDPDKLGVQAPVSVIPLVYYDEDHENLGRWDGSVPNSSYNASTQMNGLAFPTGSRSVLFFGTQGMGTPCYGEGVSANPPPAGDYCYDPSDSSKGNHAYPYNYWVWAYDVNDLLTVKQGTVQPWDVKPYAMWALPIPFATPTAGVSGVAYDPTTQRLFISQTYGDGDAPLIAVYQLNLASGPPSATVTLTATPSTVTTGGSSTLTWSSTNATLCTTSGAWSGVVPTSGTMTTSPTTTSTYTLTCGTAVTNITITVNPIPIPTTTLTVLPTSITSGNSSTLNWSSTNSTSCLASNGWSGVKATSGLLAVYPTTPTTYTLTCTGTGGTSNSSATLLVTTPSQTGILGNTTTGTDTDGGDSNSVLATQFLMPENGNVTSISVYIASPIGSNPNNKFQVAIYKNINGVPDGLIVKSGSQTAIGNNWNIVPITASLLSNNSYWLAYNTNGKSGSVNNLRLSVGNPGQMGWITSQTFGTWPTTFPAVSGFSASAATIYATYTKVP